MYAWMYLCMNLGYLLFSGYVCTGHPSMCPGISACMLSISQSLSALSPNYTLTRLTEPNAAARFDCLPSIALPNLLPLVPLSEIRHLLVFHVKPTVKSTGCGM